MKLRIRDNSIRLRLTRGEVDCLAEQGRVASAVLFPGGERLEYGVESAAEQAGPAADYTRGRLLVTLPESDVRRWAASEEVSLAGLRPLAGDDTLTILVEKDFACLTPREGEDESDMFRHPLTDVESC